MHPPILSEIQSALLHIAPPTPAVIPRLDTGGEKKRTFLYPGKRMRTGDLVWCRCSSNKGTKSAQLTGEARLEVMVLGRIWLVLQERPRYWPTNSLASTLNSFSPTVSHAKGQVDTRGNEGSWCREQHYKGTTPGAVQESWDARTACACLLFHAGSSEWCPKQTWRTAQRGYMLRDTDDNLCLDSQLHWLLPHTDGVEVQRGLRRETASKAAELKFADAKAG